MRCQRCNEDKPSAEFAKRPKAGVHGSHGFHQRCRRCRAATCEGGDNFKMIAARGHAEQVAFVLDQLPEPGLFK